jgi:hypothetical protein
MRAKPLDKTDTRLLSGTELRIWEKFEADVRLDLPFSPQVFLSWCARNEFSEVLPSAFVTAMLNRNRSFGLTATRSDYERALRQDASTAREALCWKGVSHVWVTARGRNVSSLI